MLKSNSERQPRQLFSPVVEKENLWPTTLTGFYKLDAFPVTQPSASHTHTNTHHFRGLPGKTNLDCTEARDSEWQWHQLGHKQVCTLLQIDNHASTPPLSFLQAGCLSRLVSLTSLPAAQPSASKN